MTEKIKILLLTAILIFTTFKLAYADVSIVGTTIIMASPLVSLISSWGLTLVVAILIEMLVLKKRLDLKYF